jgi:hypothetical protein
MMVPLAVRDILDGTLSRALLHTMRIWIAVAPDRFRQTLLELSWLLLPDGHI